MYASTVLSVVEREKVAANAKFGEVGLVVSVKDQLGRKEIVQRVQPEIIQEEFIEQLYGWRSVRLITGPWKQRGQRRVGGWRCTSKHGSMTEDSPAKLSAVVCSSLQTRAGDAPYGGNVCAGTGETNVGWPHKRAAGGMRAYTDCGKTLQ